MANVLYPAAREAFLNGDLDWLVNDFRVVLVDLADYTFSAAHDFLDDVAGAARVGVSAALTGKTSTSGVANADDVVITVAAAQDTFEAIIIYQHTGTDSTSRLVYYADLGVGLPRTPPAAGGPIYVTWGETADKIFKL